MTPRLLRVLVVDDEAMGRQRLTELLQAESDVEIVGAVSDGNAAVTAIQTLRPDLVFLDMQMPHMSGLDVVRAIGVAAMPATVFVTAHDNYAVDAFEVAAVDYLLKPFRDARFEEAMQRGRAKVASAPAAYPERIALQLRGETLTLRALQIDVVTANGPHVTVRVGSESHLVRESMQRMEELLDPVLFLRIHRSTIVRLDLVEALLRQEGSEYHVRLRGGVRLRVGRSRRAAVEQRLGGRGQ